MAAKRSTRKKAPRKKRAPIYGPEIRDEIVEWIAEGKTLREYCRQEGKPSFQRVYQWLAEDEGNDDPECFARRFARSRDVGEEAMLQECIEIAENGQNDWMRREGKEDSPGYVLNGEHVQRSKLRIWTRLELLKRWNPKKYGEKVAVDQRTEAKVEHSGEVRTGPPVPDPEAFAEHLDQVAKLVRKKRED